MNNYFQLTEAMRKEEEARRQAKLEEERQKKLEEAERQKEREKEEVRKRKLEEEEYKRRVEEENRKRKIAEEEQRKKKMLQQQLEKDMMDRKRKLTVQSADEKKQGTSKTKSDHLHKKRLEVKTPDKKKTSTKQLESDDGSDASDEAAPKRSKVSVKIQDAGTQRSSEKLSKQSKSTSKNVASQPSKNIASHPSNLAVLKNFLENSDDSMDEQISSQAWKSLGSGKKIKENFGSKKVEERNYNKSDANKTSTVFKDIYTDDDDDDSYHDNQVDDRSECKWRLHNIFNIFAR